jgi:aryl-alcohol dehydrogenase-like predicted oxidoreductase
LAGGFLTGKYKPGQRTLEGTRSEEGWVFPGPNLSESADDALELLLKLGGELDCAAGALAIAWVLSRPSVASALVGARTAEHLSSNLKAIELSVPREILRELTEVSEPRLPYPQWMEAGQEKRRDTALGRS